MIVKTVDGLILHTAWADDDSGAGFALTEPDEPLYIGRYTDKSENESTSYLRYSWAPLYEESDDEDDESDDESIDERLSSIEAQSAINSAAIRDMQATSDDRIGTDNELDDDDRIGTAGWSTQGSAYTFTTNKESLYSEADEPTEYVRITASAAGEGVTYDVGNLIDKLLGADNLEEEVTTTADTYTISMDVRSSTAFSIAGIRVRTISGSTETKLLNFGKAEITNADAWTHIEATADAGTVTETITGNEATEGLYFDLSEMTSGQNLDIANLKIEAGAIATPIIVGAKGENAILLQIDSANGTQFKNTGVSTTLTVTIRYGDKIITKAADMLENFGSAAYLTWSEKKLGETEFTALASDDSRIGDSGFYLTLGTGDVDEKSVFECELNF